MEIVPSQRSSEFMHPEATVTIRLVKRERKVIEVPGARLIFLRFSVKYCNDDLMKIVASCRGILIHTLLYITNYT